MEFEQHLNGISIMSGLIHITKDKVSIFHHFRLGMGSFYLVDGVAEHNVQFVPPVFLHFCSFVVGTMGRRCTFY